jgi:hypothetical protein
VHPPWGHSLVLLGRVRPRTDRPGRDNADIGMIHRLQVISHFELDVYQIDYRASHCPVIAGVRGLP